MGGKKKKTGESGEAARFISRNRAIKKLQLDLHSFNRLCIIKGIYPIEPKNRIRAQKGDSKYRPLYLKKDVKFLMHDPLMWTMRKEQAGIKKLQSAKHKRDFQKEKIIKRNKPVYTLSTNVLERYPSFLDAIKDLSDPLTMIFMFSNIYYRRPIKEHHVSRCQRLRWEFLHYVIESQCLTKAFISTNGYYYECEILGRKVVWTVPHNCVTHVPPKADMKVMKHFLEFYIEMVGFVNYRLLGKVNLRYPLKPAGELNFSSADKKDLDNFKNLMVSLNYPLERTEEKMEVENKDSNDDDMDMHLMKDTNETTRKAYIAQLQANERKRLFKGLKFFIGQENNRESLTLIIRNCGGQVSWPASVFPCSKFTEDDESITHQIVDRPNFEKKYMSRYYIQPQWVYDCLNAATLKPVQPYFPEAELPPHVCPFLREQEGWYVPPEEELLRKLLDATPEEKESIFKQLAEEEREKAALLKASEETSDEEESDDESDNEKGEKENEQPDGPDDNEEEISDVDMKDDDEVNEVEDKVEQPKPKKEVRRAREKRVNEEKEAEKEESNEYKMRAFMIHPKNKRLYNKLKVKEVKQERRNVNLKERREAIEMTKSGKMSQGDLDAWRPKPKKLTVGEKKSENYRKRVKEAVNFAKSDRNRHKNRGVVKK